MNNIFIFTGLYWLWISFIVLILDISSKWWCITHYSLGESVIITSFVNFTYVYNFGAAFSFLADKGGWQRWFFSLIAIVISMILLIMMYRSNYQDKLSNIAYAMIIGGALGNLFDRIVYGVVIDFIDFHIGDWHWPTFNIADSSIFIGTILFLLKNSKLINY